MSGERTRNRSISPLHHPPLSPDRTKFYIMAGICNLTTKLTSYKYQEVVFRNSESTIQTALVELNDLSKEIKKQGAIPIFCTIPTMHLQTWNELQLKQRKTNTLTYQSEYCTMQVDLAAALKIVNQKIIELNNLNGVSTPFIDNTMLRTKHQKTYTLYKHLSDGCHPSEPMLDKIVKCFNRAFTLNNNLH